MLIDDERAQQIADGVVQIEGALFKADLTCSIFKEGDIVIDRRDGAYAVIDMIRGNECALQAGWAVEIGVPLNQLIKLNPYGVG